MKPDDVRVHGSASPEEIAAVLAALHARLGARKPVDVLARWRRQRQQVLRENG